MEIATIYESQGTKKGEGWDYPSLYKKIDSAIESFCKQKGIVVKKEEGKPISILSNGLPITYRLYRSYKFARYFISFLPVNRWAYPKQPSKNMELVPAVKATIDLFNNLPNEINVGLIFKKSSLSGKIDIKGWTFGTNPDIGQSNLVNLEKFGQLGNQLIKANLKSIDRIPIFFIEKGSPEKNKFELIRKEIIPLFSREPIDLDDLDNVRELLSSKFENQEVFVFFFGSKEKVDGVYKKYKKYFIEKKIPSQFVNSAMAATQNILPFGKANLILEILKKDGNEPIFLDNKCSAEIDGFVYLSDINQSDKGKYFGASINITGEGGTEDLVEIYKDINYNKDYLDEKGNVKESSMIKFTDEDISKLTSKIINLSTRLKDKNIYVFVSKLWGYKNVELICELLEKNNVHIKKFIYIADKANRFVFSSSLDEISNKYSHPYIIWDSQAASIMPNSKIQFFGSIFPIYIEALKPDNNAISVSDLETILWLVKKRIYRIANFFNLRTPELLSLLGAFNKIPIGEVETLRISFGYLI